MSFPVNYQQEEMWVQVYVPVMEAISKGAVFNMQDFNLTGIH